MEKKNVGLSEDEAKQALKDGKRVRCRDWPKKEYLWFNPLIDQIIYYPYGFLDEKSFDVVNPKLWEMFDDDDLFYIGNL